MLTDQDQLAMGELTPDGILVVRGSEARITEIARAVLGRFGDNTIAVLPMREHSEVLWLSDELLGSGGWVKRPSAEATHFCTAAERAILNALP